MSNNKNKSEERIFYVYIYIDPRNNSPFYVGKGHGRRYFDHLKEKHSCNPFKFNKINKIKKETGEYPESILFKTELTEEEAFILEIELIARWGRKNNKTGCLTNLTGGGDGISGWHHNEEAKKKVSLHQKGIPETEESKRKHAETHRNVKKSEETIRKTIESRKWYKHSEETKKNIGDGNRGKIHSEESKEKSRQAHLGHKVSEETKRKQSESLKGKKRTEEQKKNISESKLGEKNPMYGRKGIDHPLYGRKLSEETIKKRTESRKGYHPTEETKRKHSEAMKGKKKPPRTEIHKLHLLETRQRRKYFKSLLNYSNQNNTCYEFKNII